MGSHEVERVEVVYTIWRFFDYNTRRHEGYRMKWQHRLRMTKNRAKMHPTIVNSLLPPFGRKGMVADVQG